jgi:predicted lipoprotein with Yx(FWY)xxD motif
VIKGDLMKKRTLSLLLAAGLGIVACGSDDEPAASSASPTTDVAVAATAATAPSPTAATATEATASAPTAATDPTTTADSTTSADSTADSTATSTADSTAPDAGAATDTPLIAVADSSLGPILVGAEGRTVYGFLKDTDGTSSCTDKCAEAWPPVIVDASFDTSTLPTPELYSVIDRADGTKQLKIAEWPLYYYAPDTAAGDVNGQGVGDVWYVVAPDGTLIQ